MSSSSDFALQIPLKSALRFKCVPPVHGSYDVTWTCDSLPYKKRPEPRGTVQPLRMKTPGKHASVQVQIGKPRVKKAKGSLIKFMNNEDWRRKHKIDSQGWLKMSKSEWFEDGFEIKTNAKLMSSNMSGSWIQHNVKHDGEIKFSTEATRQSDAKQSASTRAERIESAVKKLENTPIKWWVSWVESAHM